MKRSGLYGMAALLGVMILVGSAEDARAQYTAYKGQVVVSQKPVPAKDAEIATWLRKESISSLKPNQAGDTWEFHYVAVLNGTPPVNVLNLVFYEYRGGGFKYINAEDVKVTGSATVLIGKSKMHKVLGFAKGKRYLIRITLRDNAGNERTFARSKVLLLK